MLLCHLIGQQNGMISQICSKYILQLQLEGYSQIWLMGNSVQQKSSLLVKNWVKLDKGTYRNAITEQLIDEHLLDYASEEAMQASHGQLIGRANISHPNVIKLIYFCQDSQKNCCTDKVYRHRVFIEHQNQQLSQYLATWDRTQQREVRNASDCFCCPIAGAFAYLSEKYGYFQVKESMIFLVSQIKWHKNYDKKTVKVWINSKLQESRPERACRQEEMCKNLRQIYEKIAQAGVCNKIKNLPLANNFKLQQFLQQIYRAHNNVYQRVEQKKRVLSTYNSSNPNILRSNPANQSSQDTLAFIKTHRVAADHMEPDHTVRNLNKTTEVEPRRDEFETTKKLIPSSATRKIIPTENTKQQPVSPFYRPPNTSKINFAYNDQFSTPKQNKVVHALNSSSPCLISNQQQFIKPPVQQFSHPSPTVNTTKSESTLQPKEIQRENSKKSENSSKAPRLQRLTVNVMVESQPSPKEKIEIYPQPSEQCLTNKLAQILESEEHITSSPFLIDVNQTKPSDKIIQQRCAESINQSDYCQQNLHESESIQQEQILHYEYEGEAPEINIEESGPSDNHHYFAEPHIPLSESIRESEKSDQQEKINYYKEPVPSQYFTSFEKETPQEVNEEPEIQAVPNFGSIAGPPVLMHTSKHDKSSKKSLQQSHPFEEPFPSASHSEYSRLDSNYNKYLKKFNQAMNPISPRSKFSSSRQQQPFQSMPSHSMTAHKQTGPFQPKHINKYNSLNLEEGIVRKKSKSRGNDLEMSDGQKPKPVQSGELESLYNQSLNSEDEKKARIIERIENTEKIIRENRKKLEKIQLEKDLQREKEIIKKEMESLLKNNMMHDESNRIKEKVKYKKATFAELKAEASKILEDLNF